MSVNTSMILVLAESVKDNDFSRRTFKSFPCKNLQESPYLQKPRSHQEHIDGDEYEPEKWDIDM